MKIDGCVIMAGAFKRPLKETADSIPPLELKILIPPNAAREQVAALLELCGKSCPVTFGDPVQMEIGDGPRAAPPPA